MAERSSLINQMPIHKYIPMEKMDSILPNEVRILYYDNPSRFYVYLPSKIHSHAQFQMQLQTSMEAYHSTSSGSNYPRYQSVVAQDNHAVWHRAMILEVHLNSREATIYFVDVGQEEKVSLQNIRPLPSEFVRQPAFAIPCRLFDICPLNSTEWKSDDPVHNQFNQLLSADAFCRVRHVQQGMYYDVTIEIPKVGDLGKYLLEEKLVSSIAMRANSQSQTFGRAPPGFPEIPQTISNRVLQSSIGQQSPIPTESFTPSSDIDSLPAHDGLYIITYVYSATEFYGYSQVREKELEALQMHLEKIYNHEQSFSVHLPMEGTTCAILYNDKYHRVKIKQRVTDTRVSVKLIDRGDEIVVDTSELLQMEKQLLSIPIFAQRFRLNNHDELTNIGGSTSRLKRMILNQRVHVTINPSTSKEFYLVDLKLSNQQSVYQLLLSNDPLPVIQPSVKSVETSSMRPLRATEELPPTPPNVLSNRYPSPQLQLEEERSRPIMNGNRPQSRGFSMERNPNQYGTGRTNEENNPPRSDARRDRNGFSCERNNPDNTRQERTGFTTNRTNNFPEQRGRTGYGNQRNDENYSDQRETAPERRGWNKFNNDENHGQRTGGFSDQHRSRAGDRNDEENNGQRFPNNRGGYHGGSRFANRGNDRGFHHHQDREGGFQRRGTFPDRGRGFGARGDNHTNSRFGRPHEPPEQLPSFSSWPNTKQVSLPFESADHYSDPTIPSDTFEFVISHVEHNNDFFIQLYSKEKELSTLTENLQLEYKNAPEINLASMKLDQVCLAKSSDNCWYRAVLLGTDIRKTYVRFIDFGDTIELESRTIRQLAKKFSIQPPYAYRCMLKNIRTNGNISTDVIINRCAGQKFHGQIEKKSSEEKYPLQSKDLQQLMIEIKAIEKNPSCLIVYVDSDQHEFFIQTDPDTIEKIRDQVNTDIDLPFEEIQVNTMVISTFEDAPYRAIIQEDLDDDVRVYFVDYGNVNICSKNSLKKCPEQLKAYPYQAKRCQLSPICTQDLDQVYEQLQDHIESEDVTFVIVKKINDLYEILLYIGDECWNEKFVNEHSLDTDEHSTATTVKERERPVSANGKRNNAEILSPTDTSINRSSNVKRQKSDSEANSIEYHEGILTYIDRTMPMVALQLSESASIVERVDEMIHNLLEEKHRPSSYNIGDYVIAQFSKDDNYYRARIESCSINCDLYTVYFLDYGNREENVRQDQFYAYSDALKSIDPLAMKYSLDRINPSSWINRIRSIVDKYENEKIKFVYIDTNKSIIQLKFDQENEIYTQPKTFTANISGTYNDCFYIHILPESDALICEIDELIQTEMKDEHDNENPIWNIDDLCIVYDSQQDKHFRGRILNKKYDVQCIDYGNVLMNLSTENLYRIINDELREKDPLARACRLYGVDSDDQLKAIDEVIRHINPMERVTITVDNDQNSSCMFVMLFRENHETVNDRYIRETELDPKTAISADSSDSAIAADDDTSNEQQGTSPIGAPQAESTHQFSDTTNLTVNTINQTIDFGENDPSSSNTTIKDDQEI